MITVLENFATQEEIATLLEYCKQYTEWGPRQPHDVWIGRLIPAEKFNPVVKQITYGLINKAEQAIKQTYNLPEVFADSYNLVKWEVGDEQRPHADGELPDGVQHPYHWRDFGCVLYLHDNYEGGEIFFPIQGLSMKPAGGTLVFFTGTMADLHGVTPVTGGVRYNFASFWTKDKKMRFRNHYDRSPS